MSRRQLTVAQLKARLAALGPEADAMPVELHWNATESGFDDKYGLVTDVFVADTSDSERVVVVTAWDRDYPFGATQSDE